MMSTDETANENLQSLLAVPAKERADALARWLSAQPHGDEAARLLSRTLLEMEKRPHEGGLNELVEFLDAERLRVPLDEAAEKCADPAVKAELWRCASTSALQTADLADLPYAYAKRAVRATPANEAAWSAFQDAFAYDNTDFFEDAETWVELARRGAVPAYMPKRALAAARVAAEQNGWDARDLAALAKLEADVG
jgi:hypothetical protein